MKKRLGQLETQFLAYVQMRKMKSVRTGEVREALGLTAGQEVELFRRLTRGHLIARVRPGLFLVPAQLPLGGAWAPDEIGALNALIGDRKGAYQLCGPTVFNRYGYDEQVPNRTYVYNTSISGDRKIGPLQFTLIKVTARRLGATIHEKIPTGETAPYPTRERALLDAVYDWSRFGTLPGAYNWIRADLAQKRIDAARLVQTVLRYGDVGTRRRFGYLLEKEGCAEALLKKMERSLKRPTGYIPWIPNRKKNGTVVTRWGVVDNDK
jgi:predicted transcriptional regulator of viral defense system